MKVAYYSSKSDNAPTVADISWDDLTQALNDVEPQGCTRADGPDKCAGQHCPFKDGPAWSPVEVTARRGNKSVTAVTAAVLDLDHLSDDDVGEFAMRLDSSNYQYICHSTHGHAPPEDNRLRLILPLSRPVLTGEWKKFHATLIRLLAIPADPVCKDPARLYFLPRPRADVPFFYTTAEGNAIDVEEVLRHANGVARKTPDTAKPAPPAATPYPTDLEQSREIVKSYIRKKERTPHKNEEKRSRDRGQAQLLRSMLEGKPYAQPGARDATLNQAMTAFAFAMPLGTPFEVVAALTMPSIAATAQPEDADDPVAHWLLEAQDMYQRAQVRRTELEDENKSARQASIASFEAFLTGRKEKKTDDTTTVAEEAVTVAATEEAEEDDGDWRDLLQSDNKGYAPVGYNARIILEHAEEVGTIRWNEVTKKIEVRGGIFDEEDPETLPITVTDWLFKAWGIALNTSVVTDRLIVVARLNSYNPIREYLETLVWDRTERLDAWMTTYLHAETVNEANGVDISDWMRRIGRMWLISMTARGLDPGCQVDTVPILEGKQGVGKTTTLRILGAPWHTDTKITLGDKDSYMNASANWVVELAEVAALKRGDLETVKAYLTAREDSFRMPYGRTIGKHPRICIFIGTTNEYEGYLIDPTGNRRYWPVRVGKVDMVGLAAVRDQLFAEAVVAFRAGEEWHFSDEDAAAFEEAVTSSRAPEADAYETFIREWWPRSGNKTGWVMSADIATQALQLPKERVTKAETMRIGKALKALGWKRKQRGHQWGYYAPEAALPVAVTDPTIASIADARAKKGEPK